MRISGPLGCRCFGPGRQLSKNIATGGNSYGPPRTDCLPRRQSRNEGATEPTVLSRGEYARRFRGWLVNSARPWSTRPLNLPPTVLLFCEVDISLRQPRDSRLCYSHSRPNPICAVGPLEAKPSKLYTHAGIPSLITAQCHL